MQELNGRTLVERIMRKYVVHFVNGRQPITIYAQWLEEYDKIHRFQVQTQKYLEYTGKGVDKRAESDKWNRAWITSHSIPQSSVLYIELPEVVEFVQRAMGEPEEVATKIATAKVSESAAMLAEVPPLEVPA